MNLHSDSVALSHKEWLIRQMELIVKFMAHNIQAEDTKDSDGDFNE